MTLEGSLHEVKILCHILAYSMWFASLNFFLPQLCTSALLDFWRENKTLPPRLSTLQVKLASVPALPVILCPEDGPSHTPGTDSLEQELMVGGKNCVKPTAFSIKSLPGPNLNGLQESLTPLDLSFESAEVPAGKVTFYFSFYIKFLMP